MADVTALFWDVGGVILTNGWDRGARLAASTKFGLDWEDFLKIATELPDHAFEIGSISLDTYLTRTVFTASEHSPGKSSPHSCSSNRRSCTDFARRTHCFGAVREILSRSDQQRGAGVESAED